MYKAYLRLQVNLRVVAGELKQGCVIQLLDYTINMVNGVARPLVLGALMVLGEHLVNKQPVCSVEIAHGQLESIAKEHLS